MHYNIAKTIVFKFEGLLQYIVQSKGFYCTAQYQAHSLEAKSQAPLRHPIIPSPQLVSNSAHLIRHVIRPRFLCWSLSFMKEMKKYTLWKKSPGLLVHSLNSLYPRTMAGARLWWGMGLGDLQILIAHHVQPCLKIFFKKILFCLTYLTCRPEKKHTGLKTCCAKVKSYMNDFKIYECECTISEIYI
jgi:hypothetical protein